MTNHKGGARIAGLSSQEVDRLLSLGDGDAALVYMYTRRNGLLWTEVMPGMSEIRLRGALTRLGEAGLLTDPDSFVNHERPAPLPAEAMLTHPDFVHVLGEAERLLGRMLSPADTRLLQDMLGWRGLSAGVILLLLHFCMDETRRKLGEDARPPSMRQIDREAAIWQREGLHSEELAVQYIQRQESARNQASKAYKSLGIFGRAPSETEKRYVRDWLDMGFAPEAIAVAYDITITNTGKLTWKYCDTILRRWHDEGLHSREQIENRERKPGKSESGGKGKAGIDAAKSPEQEAAALAQTRKALERIRGTGQGR